MWLTKGFVLLGGVQIPGVGLNLLGVAGEMGGLAQ
jgi:hypothetical protein